MASPDQLVPTTPLRMVCDMLLVHPLHMSQPRCGMHSIIIQLHHTHDCILADLGALCTLLPGCVLPNRSCNGLREVLQHYHWSSRGSRRAGGSTGTSHMVGRVCSWVIYMISVTNTIFSQVFVGVRAEGMAIAVDSPLAKIRRRRCELASTSRISVSQWTHHLILLLRSRGFRYNSSIACVDSLFHINEYCLNTRWYPGHNQYGDV